MMRALLEKKAVETEREDIDNISTAATRLVSKVAPDTDLARYSAAGYPAKWQYRIFLPKKCTLI